MHDSPAKRRLAAAITLICLAASLAGCVEREMKITSEPSGALVEVSGVQVGRTPLTLPFTWYGDYEILLRYDGYQTLKTHANLVPPIYEVPPLDLLSAMAPWTYEDTRYLHFELEKRSVVPEEELIRRADELREENLRPVR
jgi:hypothetical protein